MERQRFGRRLCNIALVALFLGLALIGPGRLQQEASAEQKGPIYPSAGAFADACRKLGGTYYSGWFLHYCDLPNGHTVACDPSFSVCWLAVGLTVDGGSGGGGTVDPRGGVHDTTVGNGGVYQDPTSPPTTGGGRIVPVETPVAKSR